MSRAAPVAAPAILYLCTGYRYVKTGNVNVGDNAQQEHGLHLLREAYPGATIIQCANSLNDETTFSGTRFSTAIVGYVVGEGRGLLPRRLASLGRAALLLFNAWWTRSGRAPLLLGDRGRAALADVAAADLVFCAGSGNFHDGYMLSVGFLWSTVIVCARARGVPVVLLGQQVGAFHQAVPRAIAGFALRRASFLGVREAQSFDVAGSLGIPPARLHFTGDEGWYLPPAAPADVSAYLAAEGIAPGFIAVQMRFDANSPFRDVAGKFARACDLLAERTGRLLLLVPFSYASSDDDRQTLREIGALLKQPWRLLDCGPKASLSKGILGQASLAVGVANHFCVFAASVGVPTVGIHGTPYMAHKLEGVQRQHGHVLALGKDVFADPDALATRILGHGSAWTGRAAIDGYAVKPDGYFDWVPLGPVLAPEPATTAR